MLVLVFSSRSRKGRRADFLLPACLLEQKYVTITSITTTTTTIAAATAATSTITTARTTTTTIYTIMKK